MKVGRLPNPDLFVPILGNYDKPKYLQSYDPQKIEKREEKLVKQRNYLNIDKNNIINSKSLFLANSPKK